MRVLISGGAGFVGSSLARAFRASQPEARVVAFDNLKRRGSELNVPELKRLGVEFVHGDLRVPADLEDLEGSFDLFVEASAEPSVLAGLNGSPAYAIQTNLVGTTHALEFARRRCGALLFLSTSRVYGIAALKGLPLLERESRFEVDHAGIAEDFPTTGARSIYGATKLASELLIEEYAATYGMRALINRCGVIAGPGQFGKADQGVFTLWVANHHFGKGLRYTGFGGTGKQVRDLLHPADLFALLQKQLAQVSSWSGQVYNVGGERACSTSLREWTALCAEATGRKVEVGSAPDSASVDVPYYVSDSRKAKAAFGWAPARTARDIARDTADWIRTNEAQLRPLWG